MNAYKLDGFWLEPGKDIPAEPPAASASIMARCVSLDDTLFCLDLVWSEGKQIVLEPSSMGNYPHSSRLVQGERGWKFVTGIRDKRDVYWRLVYQADFNPTYILSDEGRFIFDTPYGSCRYWSSAEMLYGKKVFPYIPNAGIYSLVQYRMRPVK